MKVLRVTSKDVEELLQEIEAAMSQSCPKEEAFARFKRGCALAYNVTRTTLSMEDVLAGELLDSSIERMGAPGINGIAAGLLCRAMCHYIDVEHSGDREAFKTKFIAALDKAVQELGEVLEESHDASTEQSTQVSSDQPPATS